MIRKIEDHDALGADSLEWWDGLRHWIRAWMNAREVSMSRVADRSGVRRQNMSAFMQEGRKRRLTIYQFGLVCQELNIPAREIGQMILSAGREGEDR